MNNNRITAACHLVLGLLLLLLAGCAGSKPQGTPGGLVHTDEVRKMFESNSILPGHVYYYSGPEAEPEAIIGIRKEISLQARYWKKIDITPAQLQSWNRRIDNVHRIRFSYRGAWIMTPEGKQAGAWYSKFDHTEISFPNATTIIINAPEAPPVRGGVRRGFPYLEF